MYCYNNPFQAYRTENGSRLTTECESKENALPSLMIMVTALILAVVFVTQI